METKLCTRCSRWREPKHFSPDKRAKDGLYPCCKDCWQKYLIAAKKRKNGNLLEKYGITLKQYNRMLAQQQYQCKLIFCGHKHSKEEPLVVDHEHRTKPPRIRGLLCNSCNVGLGFFKDNPKLLVQAAAYLTTQDVPELELPKEFQPNEALSAAIQILKGALQQGGREQEDLHNVLESVGVPYEYFKGAAKALSLVQNQATGLWYLPASPGLSYVRKHATIEAEPPRA